MSCQSYEEQIARYVGGDLAPEETQPVEQHLRICADCAELARFLGEDRGWLASRPPEVVEVDYAAMRQEIRRGITRLRAKRRWLPALLAAAAILLTVLAVTSRRAPQTPRVAAPSPMVAQLPPVPVKIDSAPPTVKRSRRTVPPQPQLTLEAAMRMFEELNAEPPPAPSGSDSPVEMRISTRDPNITIILLQESNGDSQ